MAPLKVGLPVLAVNDARLGTVGQVRSCCFDLVAAAGHRLAMTRASVFTVEMTVSLVCMPTELETYSCPIHATSGQGSRPV
jgi:hypothetical protein